VSCDASGLEIRSRSCRLWGPRRGHRKMGGGLSSTKSTTSPGIGCKAVRVSLPGEWATCISCLTAQVGTYQTIASLDANYWNLPDSVPRGLRGNGSFSPGSCARTMHHSRNPWAA